MKRSLLGLAALLAGAAAAQVPPKITSPSPAAWRSYLNLEPSTDVIPWVAPGASGNVLTSDGAGGWVSQESASGGAPTSATYITKTANTTLSSEFALGSLSTGLLKVTTTTGDLSIAGASDIPDLSATYLTVTAAGNTYQPQLNGTGFVKASGTTISYDNATYLTTSAASSTYAPINNASFTGTFTIPDATLQLADLPTMNANTFLARDTESTGAVEVVTAADVKTMLALNNVTNESKATMFTSPTFTGTPVIPDNTLQLADLPQMTADAFLGRDTAGTGNVETITAANAKTMLALTASDVGLGNVTNESKATMFTSPTFTGTVTMGGTTTDNYVWTANGTTGAGGWEASQGGGAPTDAPYITKTAVTGLSAEFALGTLSTGLLKVTTTTGDLTTAAAGTDYAPATSGTSILKGNGSGGFSAASSGSDYLAPITWASGVLLGNGTTTAPTAVTWPSGALQGAGTAATPTAITWPTGILKGANSTSLPTAASAGTDFVAPSGSITGTSGGAALAAPASATSYSGTVITLTAAEAQAFGDVVRIAATTGYATKAQGSALANAYAVAVCVSSTVAQNGSGQYLVSGLIRNDSWSALTIGSPVYLSAATAGALTTTAPSSTGNVVQILGVAQGSKTIVFSPQLVQVVRS